MTPPLFVNLTEAARLLNRSRDVVRDVMVIGERAGIRPAYVRRKTSVDFEVADLARWWREVHEWQAHEDSKAADGKSDGATLMAAPGAPRGTRQRRGTSSSSRSATARTAGSDTTRSPNAAAALHLRSVTG